jgi:hypothetical protein
VLKGWLIAGTFIALIGSLINPRNLLSAKAPQDNCANSPQASAVLSREQLSRILTVTERDPKSKIRAIVPTPYCTLPNLEVRSGVQSVREAYPLAFDPQTWLVLQYEGDEYIGYKFSFRRKS